MAFLVRMELYGQRPAVFYFSVECQNQNGYQLMAFVVCQEHVVEPIHSSSGCIYIFLRASSITGSTVITD